MVLPLSAKAHKIIFRLESFGGGAGGDFFKRLPLQKIRKTKNTFISEIETKAQTLRGTTQIAFIKRHSYL